MKKILYLATLLLCAVLTTSCEKEEVGGTATESLAGEWYVTANVVDNGQVIEDPYGIGRFNILTYNTSANTGDEIWVDDMDNFWSFKVKASADVNALTFSASNVQNQSYDCTVTITNAKVIKNGGTQNNGKPADYITMDVEFSDDPGTIYRLEGVRYSGLEEND
ncbi:lipid-binding protein [Prevotella sp. MA2016]|uniref:lipid-binding protein n=1 Tax=Prevotella sp. MA2016 TaxID=1408310 RepID=UPI0004901F4A|nr:lipid-binding protein [Prevotella sp. MA2016]